MKTLLTTAMALGVIMTMQSPLQASASSMGLTGSSSEKSDVISVGWRCGAGRHLGWDGYCHRNSFYSAPGYYYSHPHWGWHFFMR